MKTLGLLPLAAATLLLAGCGSDTSGSAAGDTGDPVGPPPTATAPTTIEPVLAVLDVADLPKGDPPRIVFAVDPDPVFGDGDFTLNHGHDGGYQTLRPGPVGDFATFTNGRVLVTYATEGGVVVEVLGPDGEVVESSTGLPGYGLVTTPDHSIVGWLDADGVPQVLEDGATRHLSLPAVADGDRLGALAGSGTCQEQYPEGGGCTGFVDAAPDSAAPSAWVSTSHGIVDTVPHLVDVRDVAADGTLVGLLEGRAGCSGMVNPRGKVTWRTCDHELTDLSADGAHVVGLEGTTYDADTSGLSLYDRTGEAVASWTLPHGAAGQVGDVAWEDAEHVLAVVADHGRWSILRLGVDGSAEYAVAPIDAGPDFSPYRLPVG